MSEASTPDPESLRKAVEAGLRRLPPLSDAATKSLVGVTSGMSPSKPADILSHLGDPGFAPKPSTNEQRAITTKSLDKYIGVPSEPTPVPLTKSDQLPGSWFGWFHKEWPHVKKAPWSFAICTFILSVAFALFVFWLSEKFHEGTISAQAAHIAVLSLRPESVPAQEQEILSLKVEVAKLKAESAHFISDGGPQSPKDWPPLTEEQISFWATALSNSGLKTILVYWDQGVGARPFYLSLKEVGKRLKIDVRASAGSAEKPSIVIFANKGEPCGEILRGLLTEMVKEIKYPVEFQPGTADAKVPFGEVSIFIGERP